jgi:hypothetical protein
VDGRTECGHDGQFFSKVSLAGEDAPRVGEGQLKLGRKRQGLRNSRVFARIFLRRLRRRRGPSRAAASRSSTSFGGAPSLHMQRECSEIALECTPSEGADIALQYDRRASERCSSERAATRGKARPISVFTCQITGRRSDFTLKHYKLTRGRTQHEQSGSTTNGPAVSRGPRRVRSMSKSSTPMRSECGHDGLFAKVPQAGEGAHATVDLSRHPKSQLFRGLPQLSQDRRFRKPDLIPRGDRAAEG